MGSNNEDYIKKYLGVLVNLATLLFAVVILYSLFGADDSLEFIASMQLKKISIKILIISLTMPIVLVMISITLIFILGLVYYYIHNIYVKQKN